MSLSCSLQEVHYCNLQTQSNVYGLAKMCLPHGQQKCLVASLRGKVMSLEFQKTKPLSREVPFTYIPGDAEKVSIDAFNKLHYGNGVVVGITFVKTAGPETKQSQYLNIYSDTEPGSEFELDSIAQAAQNIELNFIPYQLYHTELAHGGSLEMVFLISGSDQKVHMFREDRYHHIFTEVEDPCEFFPEFADIPSNMTWMSCKSFDDYRKRITAYGCQNGTVVAVLTDTETRDVLKKWTIQHDGPITCLKLFSHSTDVHTPSFVSQAIEVEEEGSEVEPPELHLIVTSAIESTVVYRNLLEKGFKESVLLPNSDLYDSVLCTTVADVDFDGQNEILIGTYGQEFLIYKHQPKQSGSGRSSLSAQSSSESLISPITDRLTTFKPEICAEGEYKLIHQRGFADPVLSILEVDITGDGLNEIAVLSLKGLHILQHDLQETAQLCVDRMKQATHNRSKEDVFEQLLSETLT